MVLGIWQMMPCLDTKQNTIVNFVMEQKRYLKWNRKDKQQTVVEQKQGDIKFNLFTVYHIVT